MMAEQLIKRADRALGLRLPHALSSALTLALLEQCAARWFFPVLRDEEVMHRWVWGLVACHGWVCWGQGSTCMPEHLPENSVAVWPLPSSE
jgi:hypothetical protein